MSILDRYGIKHFALKTIAIPVDSAENEKYEEAMARAKYIILDGIKDHVVRDAWSCCSSAEVREGALVSDRGSFSIRSVSSLTEMSELGDQLLTSQ